MTSPPEGWTEPERELWQAYRRGAWYDLRGKDAVELRAATITQLVLGEAGPAPVRIARLRVAGARITGQLDLRDADIDLLLLFVDCVFDEPIMLSGATLRLLLDRSTLAGLVAQDARITGSLLARQVRVTGPVRLRGTHVAGNLDLTGATLANPDGDDALFADNLVVDGDLLAEGATIDGRVSLIGARIAGDLDVTGATLRGGGERAALVFAEGTARRLRLRLAPESTGNVALTDARLGRLYLRPYAWPAGCTIELDGFSVERIVPDRHWPAKARVAWIARHSVGYSPGAYEQLAAAYRREGQENDAQLVLRSKELRRHRQFGPFGQLWGWVQNVTVGFGYAPGRALLWLAGLLAAGTVYFSANPLNPVPNGEAPTWQPFVYTLDLIVPLVDFGHERAYDPVGSDQGVALILVMLGWVLAAAVVAGAGRTLKRQ